MLEKAIVQILLASNEDTCYLWEAWREVSGLYKEKSKLENQKIAHDAICILLKDKLVKMYTCRYRDENLKIILEINKSIKNLSQNEYWSVPQLGKTTVCILSTKLGEKDPRWKIRLKEILKA